MSENYRILFQYINCEKGYIGAYITHVRVGLIWLELNCIC